MQDAPADIVLDIDCDEYGPLSRWKARWEERFVGRWEGYKFVRRDGTLYGGGRYGYDEIRWRRCSVQSLMCKEARRGWEWHTSVVA